MRCASGTSCKAPDKEIPPRQEVGHNFQHPRHLCHVGCHDAGKACSFFLNEVKDQIKIWSLRIRALATSAGPDSIICKSCFHKYREAHLEKQAHAPATRSNEEVLSKKRMVAKTGLATTVVTTSSKKKRTNKGGKKRNIIHSDVSQDRAWAQYDSVHGGNHPNNQGTVMDRYSTRPERQITQAVDSTSTCSDRQITPAAKNQSSTAKLTVNRKKSVVKVHSSVKASTNTKPRKLMTSTSLQDKIRALDEVKRGATMVTVAKK